MNRGVSRLRPRTALVMAIVLTAVGFALGRRRRADPAEGS
jgi:hypothetical protein